MKMLSLGRTNLLAAATIAALVFGSQAAQADFIGTAYTGVTGGASGGPEGDGFPYTSPVDGPIVVTGNSINFPIFAPTGVNVSAPFGAEFFGTLFAPTAGTYTISLASDDGARVIINGATIVNNPGQHFGTPPVTGTITLTAGQLANVDVRYFENGIPPANLVVTFGGLQSVPEPSTLAMGGTAALMGLGGLVVRRRKQNVA